MCVVEWIEPGHSCLRGTALPAPERIETRGLTRIEFHRHHEVEYSSCIVRQVARCRGCKKGFQRLVTRHTRRVTQYHRTGFDTQVEELCDGVRLHYTSPAPACPGCKLSLNFQRVDGRVNPTIKCNARCMAATGPSCECACGGKNHGGGLAAG